MNVVFRVDASDQMGIGHLMRCLTLAEALRARGVQTHFICREHAGNLIAMLQQKAMPISVLPAPAAINTAYNENYAAWLGVTQAEDAGQTIKALNGEKPDWLVVDHYGLNIEWEKFLRPHIGRLLVIDDLSNRSHDCDVLLDQNYSVGGDKRYGSLISSQCKVLLGPRYALLNNEFRELREQLESRSHELKNILVFFTAGNDQGETLKALLGIELFGKVEYVNVVVGRSNPGNSEIHQKCAEHRWGYHCQVDYMPKLIAQADLVIGAGGSSNWERCALGVPALIAILAENQAPIAQALGQAGIIVNLGWGRDLQTQDYANALVAMTPQRLATMSARALALVDARGTERMADILLARQPKASEQSRQTSC